MSDRAYFNSEMKLVSLKRFRKPQKPRMKPPKAQPTEDFSAGPSLACLDVEAFYQPILAQLDLLWAMTRRSAARTQYWGPCE